MALTCRPGFSIADTATVFSLGEEYYTSSRELDDSQGHYVTRARARVDGFYKEYSWLAEGWGMLDVGSGVSEKSGIVREAYLNWRKGSISVSAGRKIIIWGRADQVNPTDNISPRDYTLLSTDDGDQRFGAYSLEAEAGWGSNTLSFVAVPLYRPSVIPLNFPSFVRSSEKRPGAVSGNLQWGVKWDRTSPEFDWSVSYFDGIDLLPDIALVNAGPSVIDVEVRYNRLRVLGFDFAGASGNFGFRGEAAYSLTEDAEGTDPFVKNRQFFYVVGGETTVADHWNINIQFGQRIVFDHKDPSYFTGVATVSVYEENILYADQRHPVNSLVTARVSRMWMWDTLSTDLVAVHDLSDSASFIRFKASYSGSDRLKFVAGGETYEGKENTPFGRLAENKNFFFEVKYSFYL